MKNYVAKNYASASAIEEGTAFATTAGYSIGDLTADGSQLVIDTDAKTVYVGSDGETRLWSLQAVKNVIDANPVVADEPEVEADPVIEEVAEPVLEADFAELLEEEADGGVSFTQGYETLIENEFVNIMTNESPVAVDATKYSIKVNLG